MFNLPLLPNENRLQARHIIPLDYYSHIPEEVMIDQGKRELERMYAREVISRYTKVIRDVARREIVLSADCYVLSHPELMSLISKAKMDGYEEAIRDKGWGVL
jgi:hypothetical protein